MTVDRCSVHHGLTKSGQQAVDFPETTFYWLLDSVDLGGCATQPFSALEDLKNYAEHKVPSRAVLPLPSYSMVPMCYNRKADVKQEPQNQARNVKSSTFTWMAQQHDHEFCTSRCNLFTITNVTFPSTFCKTLRIVIEHNVTPPNQSSKDSAEQSLASNHDPKHQWNEGHRQDSAKSPEQKDPSHWILRHISLRCVQF